MHVVYADCGIGTGEGRWGEVGEGGLGGGGGGGEGEIWQKFETELVPSERRYANKQNSRSRESISDFPLSHFLIPRYPYQFSP
jgi:hypothetical protein